MKHRMTSVRDKINALRGVILPEATGRVDLALFSRSASRSKYWFKTKMLAVAREKAKKTITARSKGGRSKRKLPKPKLKSHPNQLSTLQALKQSPSIVYSQTLLESIIIN